MIWIAPPWGSELPEPYAKVFVSLPFTAGLAIVFRYAAGLFLAATLVMALARRPSVLEQPELASPPVSPIVNPRFLGLLVVVFFTIIALSVP